MICPICPLSCILLFCMHINTLHCLFIKLTHCWRAVCCDLIILLYLYVYCSMMLHDVRIVMCWLYCMAVLIYQSSFVVWSLALSVVVCLRAPPITRRLINRWRWHCVLALMHLPVNTYFVYLARPAAIGAAIVLRILILSLWGPKCHILLVPCILCVYTHILSLANSQCTLNPHAFVADAVWCRTAITYHWHHAMHTTHK